MKKPPLKSRSGTNLTAEQRRAAGRRNLNLWIREESANRLDEIVAVSGKSRPDQLEELIDNEHQKRGLGRASKRAPKKSTS